MGKKESFLYLEVDYNHSLQMGDNAPPHLPFINNHPPPPPLLVAHRFLEFRPHPKLHGFSVFFKLY